MIEVSVVTPTYNRRQFIPTLIEVYRDQTFPKDKMEWIIADDGRDKVEDLFLEAAKTIPNIRYIRIDEKLRLGAKRNLLNKEAKGAIIVAMDDDDFYPPDRVQAAVDAFKKNPKVDLAGSSLMFMYFADTKEIYTLGPYNEKHATNGTMAWRKKYADTRKYDEYVTFAEEKSFLEDYRNPMIQLDARKVILVICHSDNTVDKFMLRETHKRSGVKSLLKKTELKLEDIVKNPKILSFYTTL